MVRMTDSKIISQYVHLFCANLGPHVFEDAKIVLSALSINYWVWIFVLAGSRAKWYLAIIVIMGFLVEPCKATHTVIHNTISLFALSSQHSWWAQVKEKYNHNIIIIVNIYIMHVNIHMGLKLSESIP